MNKPIPQRPATTPPRRSHALIDKRVRLAFERLPLLIGFSLDGELALADVELLPAAGAAWSDEVYEEVDIELANLVHDLADGETAELLRGRTFARNVH